MIDSNLKPWLIEVNASPSLTASDRIDSVLKTAMLEVGQKRGWRALPGAVRHSGDRMGADGIVRDADGQINGQLGVAWHGRRCCFQTDRPLVSLTASALPCNRTCLTLWTWKGNGRPARYVTQMNAASTAYLQDSKFGQGGRGQEGTEARRGLAARAVCTCADMRPSPLGAAAGRFAHGRL